MHLQNNLAAFSARVGDFRILSWQPFETRKKGGEGVVQKILNIKPESRRHYVVTEARSINVPPSPSTLTGIKLKTTAENSYKGRKEEKNIKNRPHLGSSLAGTCMYYPLKRGEGKEVLSEF